MKEEPVVPRGVLMALTAVRAVVSVVFSGPLRPVLDWMIRQMDRMAFHFSVHETFDGINLYCFESEEKTRFFETATQALTMLRINDPRRYKRVRQYLTNVALIPSPYRGYYSSLNSSFIVGVCDFDRPATFAAEIVHEATHGMLSQRGFKYTADPRRHETLCIQEQFRTMRRFYHLTPNMTGERKQELIKRWEDWMAASLRDEWWDTHKLFHRGAARLMEVWNKDNSKPQQTLPQSDPYDGIGIS